MKKQTKIIAILVALVVVISAVVIALPYITGEVKEDAARVSAQTFITSAKSQYLLDDLKEEKSLSFVNGKIEADSVTINGNEKIETNLLASVDNNGHLVLNGTIKVDEFTFDVKDNNIEE